MINYGLQLNLRSPERLIDLTIASFFTSPSPSRSILIMLTPGASAARKGAYVPELYEMLVSEHENDDIQRLGRLRMLLPEKRPKEQEHQSNTYMNKFPAEFLHKSKAKFSIHNAL